MIGSFLYLTISRPDISYSVCACTHCQANPKVSHLKFVKRIICYVGRIIDLRIWYTKDTNINLVSFSDAYWAEDINGRKSTSWGCFYMGNNLMSWYITNQNYVLLSTAESEYVAQNVVA